MDSDIVPIALFTREIQAIGVTLPQDQIKAVVAQHQDQLLNITKLSNIQPSPTPLHKTLLFPQSFPLPASLLNYEAKIQTIPLTYQNFSYLEVLKEILPKDITIPTGFETIGHIAHFNLTPPQLAYKNLIGKVLLDVISN